jgi:hypothetical protein
MDIETIAKQFTRFFVPGLAFLFFVIVIPAAFLGHNLFFGKDATLGPADAVLMSILTGYVLDSIKGYRWTPALRSYTAKKRALASALAQHSQPGAGANPDHHLAVLWKRDEATYGRIFGERAEWVMILETSFSLLCGAVALAGVAVYSTFAFKLWVPACWATALLLLAASALSARNGIDRMTAHDLKLIEAVKALAPETSALI